LKNNNLIPTAENAIKAKDIYEAFLRFDDKPMITGPEAVAKSIQKYCTNGEYCIATGDGTNYTRFFFISRWSTSILHLKRLTRL
jgi:hypothetical protein